MGRYYNGDIEGKFWFGVQDSNDADFFGVEGVEPSYLGYYFAKSDIPKVKKGITECRRELGDYERKFDKFFKKHNGYDDEQLAEALGVDVATMRIRLEWYARLRLGAKILKCLETMGQCYFKAEL